ncbi:uncharacterized protein LOC105177191 [Sesamum indicum]|uniref:Uncharacterized protein LOC105177191 n=1 Tax=Sesamum indicum TaxID=4182 RepID=A0A8M8V6W6_SESIN|nr:uncharacterized protein LOC105177191 [Sesamum indicum]
MERDEKGEDRVKAVCFAAGTAALMACIERAVVVSVFMHWRVWAFLALNLLLLAILFTSKSQTPSDDIIQEDGANSEIKKKKSIRKDCARASVSTNGSGEMLKSDQRGEAVVCEKEINVEDDGKKEDNEQLSKEELNQRVEAFIAMFRQHLVSDAKSCGLNYQDKPNSSKSKISAFGVNFGMFETNI